MFNMTRIACFTDRGYSLEYVANAGEPGDFAAEIWLVNEEGEVILNARASALRGVSQIKDTFVRQCAEYLRRDPDETPLFEQIYQAISGLIAIAEM